jgi:hypothetical protein
LPSQPTTLVDELIAAARGSLALVIGDRRAVDHFDFSQRGLVGSFIALLLAQLLSAYGPVLVGAQPEPGGITKILVMVAILFAAQVGCSALVLRQIGRLDGLVPYLVADNWATFYITIVAGLLSQIGFGGEIALFGIGILVIVVEINIARLIVTLSAWQIAMFLIAQLVGVSIGLIVVGLLFPSAPVPAA